MAVRRKPTQTSNNKGTKEQNDWTGYFVIDKRSWREYNSFMQRDGISSLERWLDYYVGEFPLELKQIDTNTVESSRFELHNGRTLKHTYKNGETIQVKDLDGIKYDSITTLWDDENSFMEIEMKHSTNNNTQIIYKTTYDYDTTTEKLTEVTQHIDSGLSLQTVYKRASSPESSITSKLLRTLGTKGFTVFIFVWLFLWMCFVI